MRYAGVALGREWRGCLFSALARKESVVALFATFGIGIIFLFIIWVLLGGLFMWIAAKIARVENSSFGRAMVAAIGASFVSLLVSFVFNMLPVFGNLFGLIIGIIVSILIIKAAFGTSFGKALIVWIFNLIAAGIAVALAAMLTASSFLIGRGF
jgi:hypothetical protein